MSQTRIATIRSETSRFDTCYLVVCDISNPVGRRFPSTPISSQKFASIEAAERVLCSKKAAYPGAYICRVTSLD